MASEYGLATLRTKRSKSRCADASARSEMVRMTAYGTPKASHTWASSCWALAFVQA